ncbi:hypothetical protein D3C72_2589980 [compost metagenome]
MFSSEIRELRRTAVSAAILMFWSMRAEKFRAKPAFRSLSMVMSSANWAVPSALTRMT